MSNESATREVAPPEDDKCIVDRDIGSVPAHHPEPPPAPASPPSQAMAPPRSEAMPPPSKKPLSGHSSRKRSNDEMEADERLAHGPRNATNTNDAHAVKSDKPDDHATNVDFFDSSATVIPDSQKQRLTQEAPTSSTANQPKQPPASAQPPKSQSDAEAKKSAKPAEAENKGATAEGECFEDGDDSSECSDSDAPDERIAEFDWRELEARYHDKVQFFAEKEAALIGEWNDLLDSFGIWATAGSQKEVNRSFKRLRTQMVYVRNEEDELEQKRLHYVKVVEAFRSALDLLRR
ncbi:Hypothetical predicted protein [Lecanosticta acicola]|uniref:Uncharacterized protein n=1 Tax=Lecanosticta acicola TaxID=111012 RepID=A0AAI9EEJ0_9PEZI|nr:Hypothetical predicted protein [Lecanosticta acicola]